MKFYEVPTMNISEFAVENVVTDSAAQKAAALMGTDASVKYVTMSEWNEIAE